MIIWRNINESKPEDGQRVLVFLDRRDRCQEIIWNEFQMEILHPSHWTSLNLPDVDVTGEILKLSATICGSRKSAKKSEAARRNGMNGGRKPKKRDQGED